MSARTTTAPGVPPAVAAEARRRRVYLDHNATSPLRPEARAALLEALDEVGNPSSIHAFGRAARRRLETAREQIAHRLRIDPERLVFTSGGTESNLLALSQAQGPVLVSAIEHPSVLENAPGAERLPVGADGRLDLAALEARLSRGPAALVALMWANNETGVLQPVAQAAALCRRFGVALHIDAAQAAGRLELDLSALSFTTLTLSAHKFGGPPGIGALVLGEGVEIRPLLRGGGQERRRRAGTENVPAAAGFAAALTAWSAAERTRLAALRDRFEAELLAAVPQALVIARHVPRLPNTSMVALPGVPAELLVIRLDLEGVAVSAGSACSSGKVERSHVLAAMGLPEEVAGSAVRVSLGPTTRAEDVMAAVAAFARIAHDPLVPRASRTT